MDIELPPADTYCTICSNQFVLECLKCQKCKHFIHTDCSELPVYAIVNFFKSRSQYTCEQCARKNVGEQVDRLFAQVLSVVLKEKETKQQINPKQNTVEEIDTIDSENGGLINDGGSVNQQSLLPPNHRHDPPDPHNNNHTTGEQADHQFTTDNGQQSQTNLSKDKVCYFYKNNKCKFGRRGENCPYAHPKLCFKYKINGCDLVRGCKNGNNCPYLHPPICNGSMRRRECFNENCKRLHLKGTRRYPSNYPETEQQQQQQQKQQFRAPPRQQRQQQQQQQQHDSNKPTANYATAVQSHSNSNQNTLTVPFLVQEMHHLQQTQQQILQMLKTLPLQWPHATPIVHQQHIPTMPTHSYLK